MTTYRFGTVTPRWRREDSLFAAVAIMLMIVVSGLMLQASHDPVPGYDADMAAMID